jgi:signal transduction histidine kinase/ligand-binding sensor domain-containing protein
MPKLIIGAPLASRGDLAIARDARRLPIRTPDERVRISHHNISVAGRSLLLICTIASLGRAEGLPVKTYTTADGLAHNSVHRIVRDSRGFLWFGTAEGLSRFDGYSFNNYGTAEGLPNPNVYNLLETRSRVYWVATGGGLCRLALRNPGQPSSSMFTVYPLPSSAGLDVHALAEGHDGTLWVGTRKGLCRSVPGARGEAFQFVSLDIPRLAGWGVTALLEDDYRTLWIGTESALYRRWHDGRLERYRLRALNGRDYWTNSLRQDEWGRILASTDRGLLSLKPTRLGCSNERLFTHRPGGARIDFAFDEIMLPDHSLWALMLDGISQLPPDAEQSETQYLVPVTSSFGLADYPLEAIGEDRVGNIWIGSDGGGVSRIARNGLVSFTEGDGLGGHDIVSVFENSRGQLFAVSRSRNDLFLNLFSEGRFQAIRVNVPSDLVSIRWHGHYDVIVNAAGEDWWVATHRGLARFSHITNAATLARARPQYYLPDENIFRLFQDRRRDLWISSQHKPENVLTIWNWQRGAFDRFPSSSGAPDLDNDRIQAYTEDRAGDVWLGLERGGLWRRSAAGFRHYSSAEGAPGGSINWLHTDHAGRIWVGSSIAGVNRIDQPESPEPTFVRYTTGEGLSSNEIQCITEDLSGRMYVCTARGVDQVNPITGHVKRYTTADGLAAGELQTAFRDRQGALWFGTQQGLSRLVPSFDRPPSAAPVMLTGIRVGGIALPLSQAGETAVSLPSLPPGRNEVHFDFVGLGFGAGEVLRYEYQLEGMDDTWSAPTSQRSVIYAGLRSGSYRFLVRAVNSDGLVSPQPAWVAFTILSPIWLRWWFLLTAFVTIGVAVHTAWRYRLRQVAALQRVRKSIATDLHDDIGSSLSQIAILSELLRKEPPQADRSAALDQIADVSRELVDSMSDIVWATDPHRDRLGDLAQRMRQFAGEVLGGSEIEFHLILAGIEEKQKLSANVRRQIYLVFKECVNNLIHHSGATEAQVSLVRENGSIVLEVTDNGKGFDVSRSNEGHGLANMRERAASLGGQIEWTSGVGGTTVKMRVPLHT